jgi:hypothetical protein
MRLMTVHYLCYLMIENDIMAKEEDSRKARTVIGFIVTEGE